MKNNENPFSRRPRNGTMEIANNEVGRRKMAAERVVGAGPPARPEVYARLEDNRVFSFSLLCTVATRCASLRLPPPHESTRRGSFLRLAASHSRRKMRFFSRLRLN